MVDSRFAKQPENIGRGGLEMQEGIHMDFRGPNVLTEFVVCHGALNAQNWND